MAATAAINHSALRHREMAHWTTTLLALLTIATATTSTPIDIAVPLAGGGTLTASVGLRVLHRQLQQQGPVHRPGRVPLRGWVERERLRRGAVK